MKREIIDASQFELTEKVVESTSGIQRPDGRGGTKR